MNYQPLLHEFSPQEASLLGHIEAGRMPIEFRLGDSKKIDAISCTLSSKLDDEVQLAAVDRDEKDIFFRSSRNSSIYRVSRIESNANGFRYHSLDPKDLQTIEKPNRFQYLLGCLGISPKQQLHGTRTQIYEIYSIIIGEIERANLLITDAHLEGIPVDSKRCSMYPSAANVYGASEKQLKIAAFHQHASRIENVNRMGNGLLKGAAFFK